MVWVVGVLEKFGAEPRKNWAWPVGNGVCKGRGLKGAWLIEGGWAGPGGRGLRGRTRWGRSQAGTQPQDHWPKPKPGTALLAARRCSSFYNLPTERSDLRKICFKDVCRCAEGELLGA